MTLLPTECIDVHDFDETTPRQPRSISSLDFQGADKAPLFRLACLHPMDRLVDHGCAVADEIAAIPRLDLIAATWPTYVHVDVI